MPAWANMGAFSDNGSSNSQQKLPLDFASPPLREVLASSAKGQGQKVGLQVKARFRRDADNSQLLLDLEVKNNTNQQIADFDIMFNKNPFGVAISGAGGKFQYPAPGQTTKDTLVCAIDKKNLDAKNPPKSPFMIQVGLKSSYDVFYFQIECALHCMIDQKQTMAKEEFKKFWEMIPKANESSIVIDELYGGYTQGGDVVSNIIEGLSKNGIVNLAKTQKQETGQTMLYFGAKTINNLPLLFEVAHPANSSNNHSVQVLFKVPVLPL